MFFEKFFVVSIFESSLSLFFLLKNSNQSITICTYLIQKISTISTHIHLKHSKFFFLTIKFDSDEKILVTKQTQTKITMKKQNKTTLSVTIQNLFVVVVVWILHTQTNKQTNKHKNLIRINPR